MHATFVVPADAFPILAVRQRERHPIFFNQVLAVRPALAGNGYQVRSNSTMIPGDHKFIRQTLAMALGAVMMMPDTDTKSEMIERLKRSMEKIDAVLLPGQT